MNIEELEAIADEMSEEGGGYAIQRVYRYSSGKAESAPDYYKTRR